MFYINSGQDRSVHMQNSGYIRRSLTVGNGRIPKVNKHSFVFLAPKLFNLLPIYLKKIQNVNISLPKLKIYW